MTGGHVTGNDRVTYTVMTQQVRSVVDTVSEVVERGDRDALVSVARYELPGLVRLVRDVLDTHAPDEQGRCRKCRGLRFWWSRQSTPCAFFRRVHGYLVPPETARHAVAAVVGVAVHTAREAR